MKKYLHFLLLTNVALSQQSDASWSQLFITPKPIAQSTHSVTASVPEGSHSNSGAHPAYRNNNLTTSSNPNDLVIYDSGSSVDRVIKNTASNLINSTIEMLDATQTTLNYLENGTSHNFPINTLIPIHKIPGLISSAINYTHNEGIEGVHTAFDVAGLTPGLGIGADLANAGLYGLRGKVLDSGISLVAAVPALGQVITGAKLKRKLTPLLDNRSMREFSLPNDKGSVWLTYGYINIDDVDLIVKEVRKTSSEPITIFGGIGGTPTGIFLEEPQALKEFTERFSDLPNVEVVNVLNLKNDELRNLIENAPGVKIIASCHSGACINTVYKNAPLQKF